MVMGKYDSCVIHNFLIGNSNKNKELWLVSVIYLNPICNKKDIIQIACCGAYKYVDPANEFM